MYINQFYGQFIVMCNCFSFSCYIFWKRIFETYYNTIWFITPFCYSNIIFLCWGMFVLTINVKTSQIKKGSSMNIGKIKQKLSTRELVDIPTINMYSSISSLKYLDYFVVSYISMFIVFRSTPSTRLGLSR